MIEITAHPDEIELIIEEARGIYDSTGQEVCVSNTLGDTVLWIEKDGTEHRY